MCFFRSLVASIRVASRSALASGLLEPSSSLGTSLNKDKLEGENSKNVYGRHSFNFSYNVYDHIQQRRKEFGDDRTNIIKANAMAALHNQSCCSATSGMSRSAKDRAFGLLGDGEELGRRKASTF